MKMYIIDGSNGSFKSLRDAKEHIRIAYTPKECRKYLRGGIIYCSDGYDVLSETSIIVDDVGNVRFGKTKLTRK